MNHDRETPAKPPGGSSSRTTRPRQPDGIEAAYGSTQAEAVDDFIEASCWSDAVPGLRVRRNPVVGDDGVVPWSPEVVGSPARVVRTAPRAPGAVTFDDPSILRVLIGHWQ